MQYVIIGAGPCGVTAAETLQQAGELAVAAANGGMA